MMYLLGVLILILLVVLIVLVVKYGGREITIPPPKIDIHNDRLIHDISKEVSGIVPQVAGAFSTISEVLVGSGRSTQEIYKAIGGLETQVSDMVRIQRSFEDILSSPTRRGAWGEMSLELILSDILPRNVFGIRKRIDGTSMIPDAHIKFDDMIVCIDSKFPLDGFLNIVNDEGSTEEVMKSKKLFRRNVKVHLEKIRKDYIKTEYGTAPFSICFIPSEAVYYYLISKETPLLREYAAQGVQVVSPLTFIGKLELIKAGIGSRKLSEEILEVQENIAKMASALDTVSDIWNTLYGHHIRNMTKKSDEMNKVILDFKNVFDRVR